MKTIRTSMLVLVLALLTVAGSAAQGTTGSVDIANQPTLPQQDAAGSANVRVIPPEGEAGSTHTILASGLTANATVTVRILRDETGADVYSSEQTVNPNGRLELEIFTTESDPPGAYTVEVVNSDGTVLGEAALTILAVPDPTGAISVTPQQAPAGSTHRIEISEVTQFEDVRVLVRDASSNTVFESRVRTAVDGTATVRYRSTLDAATGTYDVVLLQDDNGTELASTTLTIDDAADTTATLTLTPTSVAQGEEFAIDVSGLTADAALMLQIVQNATGEIIYTTERSATTDGTFALDLVTETSDAPGEYTVRVIQDNITTAEATLTINENAAAEATPDAEAQAQTPEPAVEVNVFPQTLEPGTEIFVTVSAIEPDETVTVQITQAGGAVLESQDVTGDVNGNAIFSFVVPNDVAGGSYDVTVSREDTVVAQTAFTVAAIEDEPEVADSVTVTVTPDTVERGTPQQVRVEGLPAGEQVTLEVLYEDEVVFDTQRTADPTGTIILGLTSEESDPEGLYVVRVVQDDTELAANEFVIGQTEAVQPPAETPVPADDIAVEITPQSGGQGTVHTVRVTGLSSGEQVTINVLFDNETVFSTPRTADANGTAILELRTEESDPIGQYVIEVLRDDAAIASGTLEVTGDITEGEDAEPPTAADATVLIEPDSGEIGTLHTITVTNLEPDVQYSLDVVYDGEVVFTTERTADTEGDIMLTIAAEEGDEPGTYTVEVKRADTVIASGDFDVQAAAQTTDPTAVPAADVTIDIAPTSGTVGTVHTITIEGLQPDETVNLDVRFMGEIIFTTTVTANGDGIATLPLQSEESDPAGDYTVAVLRDGEEIASGELTIEESVAQPPQEATPTPTPAPDEPTPEPTEVTAGTTSQVITGRLTTSAPSRAITFEGEAGDEVVLSLSSVDFDAFLVLEDNNGVELARGDDTGESLDAQIGPYTLPYSGEYTIIVTSFSYSNSGNIVPGAYRLLVERITTGTIAYDEPTTIELGENAFGSYLTFDATAGDVLSVTVDSGGTVDTELALIAPDGAVVASDDDGGANFDPELSRYTATMTGTYTLAVSAFNPGETGSATVTLTQQGTSTLADEMRTVRLDSKQPAETLILQGVSGEEVQLNLSLASGEPGDLTVLVEQGDDTLMNYSTTSGIPDNLTLGFVVPRDGVVTITLSDDTGAVSTLDVSIERTQP